MSASDDEDDEMPDSQETGISSLSSSSREIKSLCSSFGVGGRIETPTLSRKRSTVTPSSSNTEKSRKKQACAKRTVTSETVLTWERVVTNANPSLLQCDNIVINYDSLLSVIGNLRCKCQGRLSVERVTVGVATGLNIRCGNRNCKRIHKGMAVKPKIVESKWMSKEKWDRKTSIRPLPAKCFDINVKAVLGVYYCNRWWRG